jgi:serine/threonine protein kinase
VTDATNGAGVPPDVIVPDIDGTALAVRRLSPELVADSGFQRAFPVEVGTLRGLIEPWLAAPASYLVDDSGRVVATLRRHVEGMRLSEILERHPRGLDAQTVMVIASDVLSALSALHARWVGHRGVSAENIVVNAEGVCVLVDIGLAPRTRRESPEAVVATDLAWLADLIVLCLASRPVGRRRRPAPRLVGAWLPRTLPEPLRALLRNALHPSRGVESASAALVELSVAAVRQFDADWDVRARERLVTASWVAANSEPVPFPPATPDALRTAAIPSLLRNAGRAATHRRAMVGRRSSRPALRSSIAVAILGAGATVGIYTTLLAGHRAVTQITTYATSSATTPPALARGPATAGGRVPIPTAPGIAPKTPRATAPSVTPTPTRPTATNTTQGTTVVLSLTIIELVYEGAARNEAVVIVEVNTSGTGLVGLTLQIGGSNQWGVAASDPAATVSYSLQGKQSYQVTYRIHSARYCSTEYWGVSVYTSPQWSATQYAQLVSPLC